MEKLRLNFELPGEPGERRELVVEVPYQDGVVATSEFCPTRLLEGKAELMAAVRGESLDKFMADCRMQLHAMSKITEADSELDRHIGALMAVVMERLSRDGSIPYGELLLQVDCFSLLLKAVGFKAEEIHGIYPRIAESILNLYPEHIMTNGKWQMTNGK